MEPESANYTNGDVALIDGTPLEKTGVSGLSKFLGFALMGIAVAVFAGVLLQKSGLLVISSSNRLLVGSAATIPDAYPLKLRLPTELDGKTSNDIIEIRKRAVAPHDKMIAEGYEPHSAAFTALSDQSVWLGTLGKFGYADPQMATEGPADATRWLLNPLLLVGADVWPINPSLERMKIEPSTFGMRRVQRYLQGDSDLPFVCEPVGLIWEPTKSRGIVTYDVGSFLTDRRKSDKKQVVLTTMAEVDFNMFNARDLNFRYCYTSPKFAKNITIRGVSEMPFEITDALDADDSGSLTAIPTWPAGKFLLTGEYPASIEFLLWKEKPSAGTTPDVRFTIRFESLKGISPAAQKWVEYFRGSQDALCVAGVALADIAVNPQQNNQAARDRAMLASQRLEALGALQNSLPQLDGRTEKEVKRFVSGKELSIGYSIFSRSANIIGRLQKLPGYEQLLAEYSKPHWKTLHSLRHQ